jgi:hypothetical protein
MPYATDRLRCSSQTTDSVSIDSFSSWPVAYCRPLRAEFSSQELIFVPLLTGYCWATVGNCVWNAPQGFRPKYSLKGVYDGDDNISTLLQTTLQIRDASVRAVVDDLTSSSPSDDYLKASYQYIASRFSLLQGHELHYIR